MDRLQQAISKARKEREASGDVATSPAQSPRGVTAAQAVARQAVPPAGDVTARWAALNPLQVTSKTVRSNRLMAYTPGEAAIPFDMLRTKILQQARKNKWRRIAIVSSDSGAGKSTLAANLGFSFGRMRDKRTIILDFDLRRFGLGPILGVKPVAGMAEVLRGETSFADHALCHDGNVAYGLNRNRVQNPAELLQSPRTAEILNQIEQDYEPDLMFFDTPPLMVSDDSHGVLQSADCALLVAAAEVTPMDRIDVAERQLSELTNVMGIVLNRCRYNAGAHSYEGEYY
ncbi:MAG: chromosome partitioning protein [Pseudooceanicola sp.]|jgi:Mrp family chromosome partitioning ATPase|nr:chromosome partitioning protein [Pseudooceanicola sp.]